MDDNSAIDLSALSGGNAAYLESLFGEETAGPSWKKKNWPPQANGELISALDGNWASVEKVVTEKLKGNLSALVEALTKAKPATSKGVFLRKMSALTRWRLP